MARGVIAILDGFLIWLTMWVGTGQIARAIGPDLFLADVSTRSATVLAVFLIVSILCSLLAGLFIRRVARSQQFSLALALGVLLLIVGVVVQAQFWTVIPFWYPVSFLAFLVPATLIGATLRRAPTIS